MDSEIFGYLDPASGPAAAGGPLAGQTFAIQPCIGVQGWPTEAGSKALKDFVALEDATAIARLREAGATLIGSTRTSELGFGLVGDTAQRAIHNDRVHMALMIDTMGEGRAAAAAAGCFGFKPSYGIVSRFGLVGLVPSMECLCVLARRPADIVSVMRIIAGIDENDFSMSNRIPDFGLNSSEGQEIRIVGVVKEVVKTLDREMLAAFRRALSLLQSTGLDIREVSLPNFHLFRPVHQVIGAVEASSSCGKYDGVRYGHRTASSRNWNEMYIKTRAESFGSLVKAYLFQGAYFQFENYEAFLDACRLRARLIAETEALMENVDAVVLPTLKGPVKALPVSNVGDVYEAFPLTLPANVSGLPAVQIPGIALHAGFDAGLQLMGARLSDARLLTMASHLVQFMEESKKNGL